MVERNFSLSFMINVCLFIMTLVVLKRVGFRTFDTVVVKRGEQEYLKRSSQFIFLINESH